MNLINTLLLSGVILTGVTYSSPGIADDTIPVADFFKAPKYAVVPVLSPDGKSMAVLIPRKDRFVLAVIRLDTREPRIIASDPDWDIVRPAWVNNQRLVFSLSKGSNAVYEDQKGGGLFAVNIDGSQFRKLVPTVKEAQSSNLPYKPYQMVSTAGDDSNDLIVINNERGRNAELGATDVFRLNTVTGKTTLLTFDNPGNVTQWVLDHQKVIRAASSLVVDPSNKRIQQIVYYRDNEKTPWKPIHRAYVDEGNTINVEGFDFDNKTMLVSGRFQGRDKSAIYVWDFEKQNAGELLADHPEVDLSGLQFDEQRKKLIGVNADALIPEPIFFDEEIAGLYAQLKASFSGKQLRVQRKGENVIVTTFSSTDPGHVYFYDTKKKHLEPLFAMKPELEGKKLSETQAITYMARDGMKIPAYLTLPENKKPQQLPLVAYVHGGPHARDNYGFDPMTQTLASRGYAVLQPQFRMSTGFGWQHHKAGWKQWGLAMQDDVTDGVKELIRQGIADPKRICIIGASYGGYATMYGLIKDPDLYRCGVNWVGVTDVKMLFTVTWSDMSGPYMDNLGRLMHGDPDKDQAYFKQVSAIENADRIKAPVLMGYGSEDIRVPLIHGEKMRDKLRAKGNEVEWVVMTGEEHNWYKESNRILWGEKVINFLERHTK